MKMVKATEGNLPAWLKPAAVDVDTLIGGVPFYCPTISLMGNTFKFRDTEVIHTESYARVVIVGAAPAMQRVYFEGEFDPQNTAPPKCISENGITSVDGSKRCSDCARNVRYADPKRPGKYRYDCSTVKMLAVVALDVLPLRVWSIRLNYSTLFNKLNVPSSSLFGWKALIAHLKDRKISPEQLAIVLQFDTTLGYQSILSFTPVAVAGMPAQDGTLMYTREEYEAVMNIIENDEGIATALRISQEEVVSAPPPPMPPVSPPIQTPIPAPVPPAPAPAPAPAPVPPAPAPVPVPVPPVPVPPVPVPPVPVPPVPVPPVPVPPVPVPPVPPVPVPVPVPPVEAPSADDGIMKLLEKINNQ